MKEFVLVNMSCFRAKYRCIDCAGILTDLCISVVCSVGRTYYPRTYGYGKLFLP